MAHYLEKYPWLDSVAAAHKPVYAPERGWLVAIFAPFAVLAFFWITQGFDMSRIGYGWLAIGWFALLALLGTVNHARRLSQEDGFDLLRRDLRPPIVFLRSFYEDERQARVWSLKSLTQGTASNEPVLARKFEPLGPFVAIGRPGEGVATLGAARLYVDDAHWQMVVQSLVKASVAILLQPDGTPGTLWEIGQVAAHADPRRVLLLVPNPKARPLGYERVRESVRSFYALPEGSRACDAFTFDAHGAATPVRLGFGMGAIDRFVRQVSALDAEGAQC